jgi:hypothetical protein
MFLAGHRPGKRCLRVPLVYQRLQSVLHFEEFVTLYFTGKNLLTIEQFV